MDGPTHGRHEEVPQQMLEEAEKAAKKAMEGDDDEDATIPASSGEAMEE